MRFWPGSFVRFHPGLGAAREPVAAPAAPDPSRARPGIVRPRRPTARRASLRGPAPGLFVFHGSALRRGGMTAWAPWPSTASQAPSAVTEAIGSPSGTWSSGSGRTGACRYGCVRTLTLEGADLEGSRIHGALLHEDM
jgi:hypothetical protein